jgi:hypothetical protein
MIGRMRRRILGAVLIAAVVMPLRAEAWGNTGHQVIAKLAQARLNAKAKQRVKALLGTTNLASVAVWADQI